MTMFVIASIEAGTPDKFAVIGIRVGLTLVGICAALLGSYFLLPGLDRPLPQQVSHAILALRDYVGAVFSGFRDPSSADVDSIKSSGADSDVAVTNVLTEIRRQQTLANRRDPTMLLAVATQMRRLAAATASLSGILRHLIAADVQLDAAAVVPALGALHDQLLDPATDQIGTPLRELRAWQDEPVTINSSEAGTGELTGTELSTVAAAVVDMSLATGLAEERV